MSAYEQDPKGMAAALILALRADSGYEADAEYRINAEQWGEVVRICKGTNPVPTEPVNARLLAALRANHQWHIDHDDYDGCPGSELEATNLAAIAAAEAQQAGPGRLTDNDVVDLFQTWNTTYSTSYADLIRAVETAVLERNGINPPAKGD